MNPDRWRQIKGLFETAVQKPPQERTVFLDAACADDPDLRKEIESLLANDRADDFLEKPESGDGGRAATFKGTSKKPADKARRSEKSGVYIPVNEHFRARSNAVSGVFRGALKRLGAYEILGELGRGGMGVVYLGYDARLDRKVAVKMISPHGVYDAELRERLKTEARAAGRLSHPGIATVYSLEEGEDGLYAVFEYVAGRTLREMLDEGVPTFSKVLDVALQTARALAAAHGKGIVHRDLKPENVMVSEMAGDGRVKILDFGLARLEAAVGADMSRDAPDVHDVYVAHAARLTRTGAFLGTPAYASPEQLAGKPVDCATDIFSFGILLYELATGRHPFAAADPVATIARILQDEMDEMDEMDEVAEAGAPSRFGADIPEAFVGIVRRCLRKKPLERFADARELLAELESLASGKPRSADAVSLASFRWWQFHQAVAGFGYYGMLYPLWRVKEWLGGVEGSLLFFPALVAVGVAANLRLHLWFTSGSYRPELSGQRRKASGWIRCADWIFVVMLAVTALRIHELHAIIATLLMAVAIGAFVAFHLIEPVTAKAAFGPCD